jgi:hypothetical protein
MENIKEFYVLGQPIETDIGLAHFIKLKEYPEFIKYSPYLNLEKFEIINLIKELDVDIAKQLNDVPFVNIIKELKSVMEVYEMYKKLFMLVFKDDVFDNIENDEQLEFYKILIRQMNCVVYEKKNPNPEIERFNQLKKMYNKSKSDGEISLESMITSVWLSLGSDVFDLTVYQIYALFNRVSQFKNYDTTTLYNSVSGEVKIDGWYKHIEMIENKDEGISIDDFSNYANKIIKS